MNNTLKWRALPDQTSTAPDWWRVHQAVESASPSLDDHGAVHSTKWALLSAFAERKPIRLRGLEFVVLSRLEHEDGSGFCFNVTGTATNGRESTIFIRTGR